MSGEVMQRTNIYLSEDQLRLLKHLAAEDHQSVATLVRQAVDSYLSERLTDDEAWNQRLTQALAHLRGRIPAAITPEKIEADITAARQEYRAARRR